MFRNITPIILISIATIFNTLSINNINDTDIYQNEAIKCSAS